ncbi:MAG: hypothetical protein JSR82_04680 [Verrucomicrobia bacterium]|nr:hypothetical protein [Verrucomicrobiota bacterium]
MSKFAKRWTFQSKLRGDEQWTTHPQLDFDVLVEFRDLIWRKYQRRRSTYEDWLELDREVALRAKLEKRPLPAPAGERGGEEDEETTS